MHVTHSGSFKNTENFLKRMQPKRSAAALDRILDRYGLMGVDALSNATPVDTRETAKAWRYEIVKRRNEITISWVNDNVEDGQPIAILLQYGHATGTGGYVEGRDYINPAIRPIFDMIIDDFWRQVTR